MYIKKCYLEKNSKRIIELLRKYPLACISGSSLGGIPMVCHIPLITELKFQKVYLQGHIMKGTEHYKLFKENHQVLVTFSGPQAYISSSWYSKKESASTWNYMNVYIKGKLRFMDNDQFIAFMHRFTLQFENDNKNSPSVLQNLSSEYLEAHMPNIVGIEIEAEKIDAVFKLSQNKDKKSYLNIIYHLQKENENSRLIAVEMKKRIPELF